MTKKRILISAGPIPAKLDSVKFITNRFKGGLVIKTAQALADKGHNVTVMAWRHSDLKTNLPIVRVDDVHDYVAKVLAFEADAYVLAAAVANLGPVDPFEGKFPSHNYQVGDVIPINFTILPRVIDQVKKKYPRATLIAYKLFDGNDEELKEAAWHTLADSKANLVYANHPAWAKERKIAITQDGSMFDVSFDEHNELIHQLITDEFYSTCICPTEGSYLSEEAKFIIENYPRTEAHGRVFGTFAIRLEGNSFITTTRGKRDGEKALAIVSNIDHESHKVFANCRATLNAPLLHRILEKNPEIRYLVHDHELIGQPLQPDYQFPGTTGDLKNCPEGKKDDFVIQLPHHGYIAGFTSFPVCQEFLLRKQK